MSIDSKLEKVNAVLDEYDEKIGLSAIRKDEDVEKILSLNYKALSTLSDEECGEMAFILFQYAVFLQKENNRHNAVIEWAKHYIDIDIGARVDQHSGPNRFSSFEEKKLKIIADPTNEYVSKLNRIMMQAKVYCKETDFIANRVSQLGSCLLELQQTKRKNRYANSIG